MRVARFYVPGDPQLEDAPDPVPGPDEITSECGACSMCGTDLEIMTHVHRRRNQT